MKKLILLAMLVLFAPLAHADDMWFYTSRYLVLDIGLSTEFDIVSHNPNPDIDFITANITFFPKKTLGQAIISSDFRPEPKMIGDTALFEWRSPTQKRLGISMESKVKVMDTPVRVTRKIDFPLKDVPDEIMIYTKPAEIIDIDDNIIDAASSIASGKDDLVDVVDSIAVWVNTNIHYNFTTVTAEASQKASWVIVNKRGVCDELTSLFIAMLRSLGIPARFVAGISYTSSDRVTGEWGPHGWAEVYFPGHGWVPYDVTYGEYSWIDPTHIVCSVSNDAEKISSTYLWKAESGVSLDLHDLKTHVGVDEIGAKRSPDVLLSAEALKDTVAFGSFNFIKASVKNLKDYYISKDIYVTKTNRLSNIDDIKKHVLLRPGETKEVYWIFKVDDDLDEDFIYTFPVEAFTLENITSGTTFTSVEDAQSYTLDEVENIISLIEKGEERGYSKNLEVICLLNKTEFYAYENPIVQCNVRNIGNIFLKNLQICIDDICTEKHLGITQEKQINFTIPEVHKGENDLVFSIENDQISKIEHIIFQGLDEPELDITDIEYPAQARYNDNFQIKFTIKKESDSEPKNVRISLSGRGIKQEYFYESLEKNVLYKIGILGKSLQQGQNNLKIDVQYEDMNGKEYSGSEDIAISLVDVTFFQKIALFFMGLFN
ncbi:transglutaminase family protein [Thermoproteota archaeon]